MTSHSETAMIKRLTKHGNSLALVIDRAILELLEIDVTTPLSISTDGDCLVVSPVHDPERRKRFEDSLKKVNKRHGGALKKLAE
jgi:antitoxin component of MazEF toxin-antitoxin module